jgi:hypothetical protein
MIKVTLWIKDNYDNSTLVLSETFSGSLSAARYLANARCKHGKLLTSTEVQGMSKRVYLIADAITA